MDLEHEMSYLMLQMSFLNAPCPEAHFPFRIPISKQTLIKAALLVFTAKHPSL